MFNKTLSGLTLTKQVADGLFQNINGQDFRGDTSFLATLRALMYKRVPKEESILLRVSASRYGKYEIDGATAKDCVRAFLRNTDIMSAVPGVLHIHTFDGDEEGNTASFAAIDNGGLNAALGNAFTALPDVSKFLEQNGKVRARVFISEERKSVLIFVEKLDIKRWHLLQSLIPRYMPWYVRENPFNDEEVALIRSLTKRYAPDYTELIEQFAKKFDFRTQAVRNMLRGFENAFEKDKLQAVQRQITDNRNRLERLEQQFRDLYVQIADLTTQELGLIAKIRGDGDNGEDTEFMEYFLCNKSLNLVRVSGGEIEFIVETTISSYDPEVVETALDKFGKSFFYRHYETHGKYQNKEMTDERIHRLVKALFLDEVLKLRVCAAYRLNFANGGYYGLRNYNYPAEILVDHVPNQHIQVYGCLGNNESYIRRAMVNRDYVAAVSNCCASATNANFTEANTGTFFMQKICANDVGKIIQMPDGSTATPLDAVKWLEAQDAEKQKKKEEAHE